MPEQSPDISGAISKLLEDPQALQRAMAIAESLKSSGILDGIMASGGPAEEKSPKEEKISDSKTPVTLPQPFSDAYEQEGAAYNEINSREEQTLSGQISLPQKGQKEAEQRRQLLLALRPYMSRERQERIDHVLKIMRLLDLAGQLGNLGILS